MSVPIVTPDGTSPSQEQQNRELAALKAKLHTALRQFPDFPSPGIVFEDIMPLFYNPSLHNDLIRSLELYLSTSSLFPSKPNVIVGLDARGFLFGPSLALRLGSAFVPVRKAGKLPGPCVTANYEKEYGKDQMDIQQDAIKPGQTVVVVDDIIATGGSAAAAGSLVNQLGGQLIGFLFILELDFLKGRDQLQAPAHTLLSSQSSLS